MFDKIRSGLKNVLDKNSIDNDGPASTDHNSEIEIPLIGHDSPICPYCNSKLEKMPARKKKCPSCGEFIFVRTRPSDRKKILVTAEQAEQVEEQWSIVNGTHDDYLARKKEYEDTKSELKKRFGIDPPENDILWAIYNKQRTKYFLSQDFGHYRNTTLAMAQILYKESRLRHALEMYCEVFYIDLNGPQNLGGTSPEILKKFPPFDPDGFIVPRMVEHIEILAEKNNLSTDELKTIFIDHNRVVEKSLETPLSPAKAWEMFEEELSKAK